MNTGEKSASVLQPEHFHLQLPHLAELGNHYHYERYSALSLTNYTFYQGFHARDIRIDTLAQLRRALEHFWSQAEDNKGRLRRSPMLYSKNKQRRILQKEFGNKEPRPQKCGSAAQSDKEKYLPAPRYPKELPLPTKLTSAVDHTAEGFVLVPVPRRRHGPQNANTIPTLAPTVTVLKYSGFHKTVDIIGEALEARADIISTEIVALVVFTKDHAITMAFYALVLLIAGASGAVGAAMYFIDG
ncbi:hypothetical protein EJ08DRAFT_702751 [Tothia fuscella]|uniref:Uncharacterized protein n=1 Tax=Tothia fuscella TaxID=1048955 RepID=A0A9P4NFQ9_9PEZI|nr:hypothetical protein EJ08DRAFT_702751 [Tothia fuscella]